MSVTDLNDAFDRIEKLLEFPADFPIKVMGKTHDAFERTIEQLVAEHIPGFKPNQIKATESRRGTFTSLTVTVTVDNRNQLQSLYQALAEHEMVKIVL